MAAKQAPKKTVKKAAKKAVYKAKKPVAKKARKQSASARKTTAKKTAVKKVAQKKPVAKQAKKPAAKKVAKKVTKPVAKNVVAKKPAAPALPSKSQKIFDAKAADLMKLGRERGYITYDEILKYFPQIEKDVHFLDGLYEKFEIAGIDELSSDGILGADPSLAA